MENGNIKEIKIQTRKNGYVKGISINIGFHIYN